MRSKLTSPSSGLHVGPSDVPCKTPVSPPAPSVPSCASAVADGGSAMASSMPSTLDASGIPAVASWIPEGAACAPAVAELEYSLDSGAAMGIVWPSPVATVAAAAAAALSGCGGRFPAWGRGLLLSY